MTVQEFIAQEKKKWSSKKLIYDPFERAVKNIVAQQAKRIFTDGQNSAGGNIGQYDTRREMYINPNVSPGATKKAPIKGESALKPPRGKHGQTHFKDGAPHKTTWVANYKSYRNRIGRRIDKVNLNLSGDLQRDFSNATTIAQAKPIKISNTEYIVQIKRENNQDKAVGLEKKYGKIFPLQKKERVNYYRTLIFNFKKALIDG